MAITTISYAGWDKNTTLYTRVLLEENNDGYNDDLLTLEYFTVLEDAQSGFTDDNLTYSRFIPYWSIPITENTTQPFGINSWLILFGLVFPLIIFIKKKKQ